MLILARTLRASQLGGRVTRICTSGLFRGGIRKGLNGYRGTAQHLIKGFLVIFPFNFLVPGFVGSLRPLINEKLPLLFLVVLWLFLFILLLLLFFHSLFILKVIEWGKLIRLNLG